jgi:Zn/Cd-binding protein ZinT
MTQCNVINLIPQVSAGYQTSIHNSICTKVTITFLNEAVSDASLMYTYSGKEI